LRASSHRLSLGYRVSINLSLPLSTADDANRAMGNQPPRIIRLTADDVDAAGARRVCSAVALSAVSSSGGKATGTRSCPRVVQEVLR
jgi:hypothetical protein